MTNTHPHQKSVLIVEDNAMNMKLFVDVLEIHGFKTIATMDGTKALSLAREHNPDVVLMDIQLSGIDGRDVTTAIKADPDLAHIPVLAVTACTMKGDEDRFRACGCEGYIAKPFTIPSLIAAVRHYSGLDEQLLPKTKE